VGVKSPIPQKKLSCLFALLLTFKHLLHVSHHASLVCLE
jgi:hypothetical protein